MAKNFDFEDDNRTISDMSGIEKPSLFGHLPSTLRARRAVYEDKRKVVSSNNFDPSQSSDAGSDAGSDTGSVAGTTDFEARDWKTYRNSDVDLTPQEKRWYILGVIRASLLIGLCFALGIGLIILLMVLFW